MRIQNYQKEMENILAKLDGARPRLLLHCCCAPCSSYCLEVLIQYFDVTVYFYNPNIDTAEEFEKRLTELRRLTSEMSAGIDLVAVPYDATEFFDCVGGFETQPEGGERCRRCIGLRLENAARYAADNKFDFFTTTLSVSPLKDAAFINEKGAELSGLGVPFLYSDFKKKGGYLRTIELSRVYNLYRQNYCGCIFSKRG